MIQLAPRRSEVRVTEGIMEALIEHRVLAEPACRPGIAPESDHVVRRDRNRGRSRHVKFLMARRSVKRTKSIHPEPLLPCTKQNDIVRALKWADAGKVTRFARKSPFVFRRLR